jgi:hypothetical protein
LGDIIAPGSRIEPGLKSSSTWPSIGFPRYLDVQFVRDFVLGTVLFHEIGHHLHYTVGSAQRGGESSAHDWEVRLGLVHFRKHCRHQRSLRE